MKNIKSIEDIKKDFITVSELVQKYSEAIYEPRPVDVIPPGHYDDQSKLIQQTMTSIRTGFIVAYEGLQRLKDCGDVIKFDESK